MSDNDELVELEPLDDEAHSADLPDLPDLPDMVELTSEGDPSTEPPGPATPRELDKAPLHLRTASLIVVAGGLLPWMGDTQGMWSSIGAKVGVFAGLWLTYCYFKYRAGESLPGFVEGLVTTGLGKEKKVKPKRRRGADAGPPPKAIRGPEFPTLAHAIGIAITLLSILALPLLDEGVEYGNAVAEIGMLAWGAATLVHIYGYERGGGRFNPIFPLMFFGHAAAGILALLSRASSRDMVGMVGAGLTAAGGLFAAYTIFEALKAAKSEGDAKKMQAIAARKASRGRS